ncbi:TetR/AcrR family transcriptional regulator [Halorubrum sp. 48-1-W]|uniref:TetR/AcrR family transcriptional regulator n=1 Tax=Halorubrum sp. 48-1-W TaxID=2249761 RepID=UPI000DCE0A07|nr:TetR/AcrR family transcriptional regulator [Halorubrum sp. 48-1-W]RAW47154.1 TetR/AcrR family transcriptional regulator [Halorubrum sp. 48-1-W]
MSRFSDAERDRIRSELVADGRELFARFGFDRTRIKDVTESVGIGTSTFYQFFDSKEALYVAVLHAERERLESRIDEAVSGADTPREEVTTMLRTTLREVRSNPLASRLIVEGELQLLSDQLSEAERQSIGPDAHETELPHASRWAAMDEIRYDDPALLSGLLRSLIFVTRAQDSPIGALAVTEYEAVEAALIETVVDGLFVE